jgi:hypothetical protein
MLLRCGCAAAALPHSLLELHGLGLRLQQLLLGAQGCCCEGCQGCEGCEGCCC